MATKASVTKIGKEKKSEIQITLNTDDHSDLIKHQFSIDPLRIGSQRIYWTEFAERFLDPEFFEIEF